MVQPSASVDLYVLAFSGTLALLLLVLGVVGFVIVYQKRLAANELRVKEMEIHYQQDVIYQTLDAVEDERKRIARDLHDEVGASLSAMRLLINQLVHIHPPTEQTEGLTAKFKGVIDTTIDSVRRISNDLLPQGLDELGLSYALEGLCENAMDLTDMEVDLTVDTGLVLPTRTSLLIYRLIQELLNNAVKHAQATIVNLILNQHDTELVLQYRDNGVGFNYDEAYQKRSLGLKNIETRAQMLHGTASFSTQPGEGLHVTFRIPL